MLHVAETLRKYMADANRQPDLLSTGGEYSDDRISAGEPVDDSEKRPRSVASHVSTIKITSKNRVAHSGDIQCGRHYGIGESSYPMTCLCSESFHGGSSDAEKSV